MLTWRSELRLNSSKVLNLSLIFILLSAVPHRNSESNVLFSLNSILFTVTNNPFRRRTTTITTQENSHIPGTTGTPELRTPGPLTPGPLTPGPKPNCLLLPPRDLLIYRPFPTLPLYPNLVSISLLIFSGM